MRIGILGGGQLGRMMGLAGHPLGISCRTLEPGAVCPSSPVAEHHPGDYEDLQALYRFSQGVDAVTYEFENVPVESARWLAERVPVYPSPQALEIAQERVGEKTFFQGLGVKVPPFAAINSRDEFDQAIRKIGLPAVLKTTRFGYDGKGQTVIRDHTEVEPAWQILGGRPLILEGFVPFDRELSILGVRSRTGECVFYPLVENVHRAGILRRSSAPAANISESLLNQAREIARRAMEAMNYVGVLAVELFQTGDQLLVNEMAPRVHNSGHWTIEGSETSQFENHLRAVAGLPLGSTDSRGHSVMLNLIGNWPTPSAILAVPGAHLHLYGKSPRPNRKVGHITIREDNKQELNEKTGQIQKLIDQAED
ncbi:5-(carboxyamino)imidazole ribonucleotide synthase [Zavarzinella formosa]|uniref:5-(carboxyamino)imidazole ribonucleotide synthase n=1 Tax=Zavarzinella formosa TaxID=360055 RepID=UPI0002E66E7D|nr:5-(carboxyamino)imidazole ribonucleotide synthase [Zavarzinella formosa]